MAVAVATSSKATPTEVLQMARESGIKVVDVRFSDLFGTMQHFSVPLDEFGEDVFEEGLGFDASSVRGFQAIEESDMLLFPDPDTAVVDPILQIPTMAITCDVVDPLTHEPYSRDPRYIARKAEAYLKSTGIADTSYWGPEAEFYIFNDLRFDQNVHSGYYYVDSEMGLWNSGSNGKPNLGYRPRAKGGYFQAPPIDKLQDLRSEMMLKLIEAGITVEVQHGEVGTGGQSEIDLRFGTLVKMADQVVLYKYIVRNVADRNGLVATFMPKPLFGDNGTGMHTHQSLWKDGETLMYDASGYAGLSDLSRYYIGGLLAHAPALLAICAPTTNSYRRLVPGYEAPINLVYSKRNRSACVRIPMYSDNPKAKRIEFRSPDPTANPYLAFPAMLMAGLDGIKRKLEPPAPLDKDIYELEGPEKDAIANVPGSLAEAVAALRADHDFLLEGGVFTEDVLETYLAFKDDEVDQIALRPHPWEFALYHDA